MGRVLAALLAAGVVAGATVALASQPRDAARAPVQRSREFRQPLPAPDAAVPRDPGRLAATLTATTRRLRHALRGWDGTGAVPEGVSALALFHQRMLRVMSARRALGDATVGNLPADVRGEARDTVRARRALAAIPRSPGRLPRVRVARAAPAATLRRAYAAAERRFGVPWSVLGAINFVESAFGRIRSASEAGARGPMQFLPATWREFGMGGDIDDPEDAILAAANYLHRAGAPRHLDRALFAYNHATAYVRAVRLLAHRMRVDERTFLTYYAWQVFVRTPAGVRRLTGPGRG